MGNSQIKKKNSAHHIRVDDGGRIKQQGCPRHHRRELQIKTAGPNIPPSPQSHRQQTNRRHKIVGNRNPQRT